VDADSCRGAVLRQLGQLTAVDEGPQPRCTAHDTMLDSVARRVDTRFIATPSSPISGAASHTHQWLGRGSARGRETEMRLKNLAGPGLSASLIGKLVQGATNSDLKRTAEKRRSELASVLEALDATRLELDALTNAYRTKERELALSVKEREAADNGRASA